MAIPIGTEVEITEFTERGCTNNIGKVSGIEDSKCCPSSTGGQEVQRKSRVRYLFESCGQCKVCYETWCDNELIPINTPISLTRLNKK